MASIVEVNGLVKEYPGFTLNNVNLEIPYGKVTGLIGENGAGKTTLISLILNQRSRNRGDIKVFGMDNIVDERKIKADIGFVVEECSFHACLTARNINSIMKSVYREWSGQEFFRLLERLDLSQTKRVSEMSKGTKSKLMLAVALAHNAHLLILDEVTSGLDPVTRDDVLHILREFVCDETRSVFFSTHITSDLDKIADHVAFLHRGNLVFMEPMDALKKQLAIVRCPEAEAGRIDRARILAQYREGGRHVLLLSRTPGAADIGDTPTIDDIMLLYIRGRAQACWGS